MSTLPIEQSWLVIANLSSELHKKGIQIPKAINKDLGLVKSQIGFYKKDPSHPDMINEMAKADMSLLETVLYLADFTSADRDYDDVDVMRSLVEKSMYEALKYALSYTVKDLALRELAIHPDTLEAYNQILILKR